MRRVIARRVIARRDCLLLISQDMYAVQTVIDAQIILEHQYVMLRTDTVMTYQW